MSEIYEWMHFSRGGRRPYYENMKKYDLCNELGWNSMIGGHEVASAHAAQCNMDESPRDSIMWSKHAVDELCIVCFAYSYDFFGDQDNWRLVLGCSVTDGSQYWRSDSRQLLGIMWPGHRVQVVLMDGSQVRDWICP